MELQAIFERAKVDSRFFSERLLKLVYKGKVHNWEYNPAQEYVQKAREKQEKAGKPVRLVVIKARREGVSTQVQGWLFHKVSTQPYRLGIVVSHELDSADKIAEISRRFWTFLPEDKRPSIPGAKLPHNKTLVFDKMHSELKIETANDLTAGRSMAIDYIHASEVAFWRNADDLMLGLLQCIDDQDKDTMVIIESTANGVGGYFYDMVVQAQNGENDYELVFLPWFIDPRYSTPAPSDFKATVKEEKLRTLYKFEGERVHLTDDQLYWRRQTIRNKCKGDEQRFKQEYPGSVSESFLFSGRTRFNQDRLTEIESEAKNPKLRGFLKESPKLNGGFTHKIEENDNGYLTVYETPQNKAEYVLFADVSEGKEVKERVSDFSAVDVLRCDTMEQVAHWHGRIPPEKLAEEIVKLAHYYNNAFVGVEKNNMGYSTVATLKDTYDNLYINVQHDRNGKEITREFGWRTTLKTKPLMIDGLAEVINEKEIKINNPGTIEELRRYSLHPDGTLGAPQGGHDDRVISLSGAVQMYLHQYSKPYEPDEDDDDEDDDD